LLLHELLLGQDVVLVVKFDPLACFLGHEEDRLVVSALALDEVVDVALLVVGFVEFELLVLKLGF
jgi:hypothetical protein